ncbi:MAG: SDR family oxidoreductase [Geminicoccaceae bacterium]|nr:SDR family oxidoreductase [Geminicoccaceae bacterium]
MNTMSEYRGKRFVVTGAAGGIGRETCAILKEKGASLHLIDVAEGPLRERAGELGGDVSWAVSTIDTPAACRTALEAVDGPVYGLIHLAGIFKPEDFNDRPEIVYDQVMAANLHNAFHISTAIVPRLDPDAITRMVFISSLAFRRGAFDHTAYSAAKGGITGLVRSLSRRLAPATLVNGLAPGHIDTSMPDHIWSIEERAAKMLSEIPLKRRGHPRECATVIDFLCGGGSTYMTGQVLNVDGGIVAG